MRNIILSLVALALVTSCSTIPSDPKPHESKFTVQVIEMTLVEPLPVTFPQDEVPSLIEKHKDSIVEYPIVYAAIGETAIADETESVSFPVDYKIIDGEAVSINTMLKLGMSVEVTFLKKMYLKHADDSIGDVLVEYTGNDSVLLELHAYRMDLAGYNTFTTKDEIEVEMPYFSKFDNKTQVINKLGKWAVVGVLEDSETGTAKYLCVRVLPPIT